MFIVLGTALRRRVRFIAGEGLGLRYGPYGLYRLEIVKAIGVRKCIIEL